MTMNTYLVSDPGTGEPVLIETIAFTETSGVEAVQLQETRVTVDVETGGPVVYRGFGQVVRGPAAALALQGLTDGGKTEADLLAAWQAWNTARA
jgi:hypothetical protein